MAKSDTEAAGKAAPDKTASSGSSDQASAEVWDAVDELYALTPSEFIGRRAELAAQAKQSGDKALASQIAALRKPTVSAWTVNTLARTQPELVENLIGLGEQLRQAQRTLDGAQLRELSKQRRTLLDALARVAFRATGQQPSASVQEEVVATLSAALADPDTADALRAGNLVRAAHADGFGIESWPELALVGAPPATRKAARAAGTDHAQQQRADDRRAEQRADDDRAGQQRAGQQRAEQQRAEQRAEQQRAEQQRAEQLRADRERAARRTEVERAARTAQAKLGKAERSEQVRADRVEDLERQLTSARQSLDEARFALRRAQADLAEAERSLDELS